MKQIALALIVLCACDPTPRNRRIASALTLAVSTAALACDAGQTIAVAQAGWPNGAHEGNWIMGPTPSVGRLTVYNTAVAGASGAVWFALPDEYDWIAPLAIGMVEMMMVARNTMLAPRPFCGIR